MRAFVFRSTMALAALVSAVAPTSSAPLTEKASTFDGQWMTCTSYQGAFVCSWVVLAQRDNRVCGLQGDFATNAYYEHRLVGTAQENTVRIGKICGTPGAETDTYCADQTQSSADKVGWSVGHDTLLLCGDRLYRTMEGARECKSVKQEAGLTRVTRPATQGPTPEDLRWIETCLAGDPPLDE